MTPDANDLCVFAVKRGYIESKEIYLSSGKLNVPHEIGYAMGLKKDLILVHNGTSEEAEKHIPSNIRMFEQIRFNGDYQTLQNEIKRRLIDYYKL